MAVLTMRSCKRYAVRRATCVTRPDGELVTGLLIELSQEGGRISGLGSETFAMGDLVVLELGPLARPSVVRGAGPGVIGVRFAEALYTAELNALLMHRDSEGNSAWSTPPGFAAA